MSLTELCAICGSGAYCWRHDTGTSTAPPPDPDAVMVWNVLMASPNRDKDGMLLAAAEAYAALKSSRERSAGSSTENGETR
jgi:hypothetical protein